jgi:hypothetical protein
MEQRAVIHCLTVKGLKTKQIEMDGKSPHDNESLQISAVKKWRRPSGKGEQSSEMIDGQEGPPILI